LPHLIHSADMGNSLINAKTGDLRMRELTVSAPRLEPKKVTQLAALPLGGRIKVDPWDNTIQINKSQPVQLLTPREKMPLEVTPVFPHLSRISLEQQTSEQETVEQQPDAQPASVTDTSQDSPADVSEPVEVPAEEPMAQHVPPGQ